MITANEIEKRLARIEQALGLTEGGQHYSVVHIPDGVDPDSWLAEHYPPGSTFGAIFSEPVDPETWTAMAQAFYRGDLPADPSPEVQAFWEGGRRCGWHS